MVMRELQEYYENWERETLARGTAKGEAQAVLTVLRARGIHVPQEILSRIEGTTDLATLDTWLTRAATARTLDEVLATS